MNAEEILLHHQITMAAVERSSNATKILLVLALLSSRAIGFYPNTPYAERTPSKVWASDSSSSGAEQDSVRVATAVNVLGTSLQVCCSNVRGTGIGTGFYRDGCCTTGEQDVGRHTVCVQVSTKFLDFSRKVGNDLSTPAPEYMFPGLKDGDVWCLCAQRWVQAYENGVAPKVFLRATHEKTLSYVPFDVLREYAIDREESEAKLEELKELRDRLNKLL